MALEGSVEGMPMALQRGTGIDIARGAEALRNRAQGDLLRVEDVPAVLEMIHPSV
jgi:hypothetical protein